MQKQYYEDTPLSEKKMFYSKSLKTVKNSIFTTYFKLYFLTNEITSVHDSGSCFIEYVFELYFQ